MHSQIQAILHQISLLKFQICCLRNTVGDDPGGGGGVETVTGDLVDNTDPLNPIVATPNLQQVTDAGAGTTNALLIQGATIGNDSTDEVLSLGENVNAAGQVRVNLIGYGAVASADDQTVLGSSTSPLHIYHVINNPLTPTLTNNYLRIDINGVPHYIRLTIDSPA